MTSDFTPFFMLLQLPCGCVVEALSIIPGKDEPDEICELCLCVWCGATFNGIEFAKWCRENGKGVYLETQRTLLKHEEFLLEYVGKHCDCGAPMLREYGGKRECHFEPTFQPVAN